jgi:hypothetical protein
VAGAYDGVEKETCGWVGGCRAEAGAGAGDSGWIVLGARAGRDAPLLRVLGRALVLVVSLCRHDGRGVGDGCDVVVWWWCGRSRSRSRGAKGGGALDGAAGSGAGRGIGCADVEWAGVLRAVDDVRRLRVRVGGVAGSVYSCRELNGRQQRAERKRRDESRREETSQSRALCRQHPGFMKACPPVRLPQPLPTRLLLFHRRRHCPGASKPGREAS